MLAHIVDIIKSLTSRKSLAECFFEMGPFAGEEDDVLGAIATEDSFAAVFGNVSTTLAAERMRRCVLMLDGWPWKAFRFLAGGGIAREAMEEFDCDHENFLRFKGLADKTKQLQKIQERSLFNKVSVKWVAEAWKNRAVASWESDFKGCLRERLRVMIPTQLVEDIAGTQKNSRIVGSGRKFRRPERSFAVAIKHEVPKTKHKFETVKSEIALVAKTTTLGGNVYEPRICDRSLNWNQVVGTGEAEWHSPCAANVATNVADLAMMRQASLPGHSFEEIELSWMGMIFDVKHCLVFCEQVGGVSQYFFGLSHWVESSAVVWPVSLHREDGKDGWLVCFTEQVDKVVWKTMTSMDTWTCSPGEWVSWPHQQRFYPWLASTMDSGIRLKLAYEFQSVKVIVAKVERMQFKKTSTNKTQART